jgi:hypothetical protein
MDRQLMRVAGTMRRPVLPSGSRVAAADERSRFDGHKQSPLKMWIRFDPSNVVRLRPRRKTPFACGWKRSQVTALFPGLASIFGAEDRARFGPGIDNAAILHPLGAADRYRLNSGVPNAFPCRPPTLSTVVAAPEA